jgi:hypothetical protein
MSPHDLPDLEERLSRPTPAVIDLMRQIPADQPHIKRRAALL